MKPDAQTKEMRDRLALYLEQDTGQSLTAMLRRMVEDPVCPRSEAGRFRISSILLLLGVLSAFSIGAFLYFSLVRP
jgi:hypothetical protein